MTSTMKEMLLKAPDDQLDRSMLSKIEDWYDPPTSLQILEVLDQCIYCSLASGFVIKVLNILLDEALKNENQTLEDILPSAHWRNDR